MNSKEIEKINKKINLAKEYAEYLKEKNTENYKIDSLDVFIPDDYQINKKIKDLNYIKDVLEILTSKKIDINKKYKITDNTFLAIDIVNNISIGVCVDNDGWLYDNFIESHSGINEWFFHLVADAYDLYSGNSNYNYALGCFSFRNHMSYIENQPKDNYSERPHTAMQVANAIENIIKFFEDKDNPIRKAIVKEINFKFNMMKKIISKEGE